MERVKNARGTVEKYYGKTPNSKKPIVVIDRVYTQVATDFRYVVIVRSDDLFEMND